MRRGRLLDTGSETAGIYGDSAPHKGPPFVHASPELSTAERNAMGESLQAVVEESSAATHASRRCSLIATAALGHARR